MEFLRHPPGFPGPPRCVQFAVLIGRFRPIGSSWDSSTCPWLPPPPALGGFRVEPGRPLVFRPTRTLRCVERRKHRLASIDKGFRRKKQTNVAPSVTVIFVHHTFHFRSPFRPPVTFARGRFR